MGFVFTNLFFQVVIGFCFTLWYVQKIIGFCVQTFVGSIYKVILFHTLVCSENKLVSVSKSNPSKFS